MLGMDHLLGISFLLDGFRSANGSCGLASYAVVHNAPFVPTQANQEETTDAEEGADSQCKLR